MSTNALSSLGQRIENIIVKQSSDAKREKNRGVLALIFVVLFFGVIFASLWIGYHNKDFEIGDYKDLLTSISSILSGPLGFIIGFYFKEQQRVPSDHEISDD